VRYSTHRKCLLIWANSRFQLRPFSQVREALPRISTPNTTNPSDAGLNLPAQLQAEHFGEHLGARAPAAGVGSPAVPRRRVSANAPIRRRGRRSPSGAGEAVSVRSPRSVFGADPVPQRPRRLQAPPSGASEAPLGAPLRGAGPVGVPASAAVDLPCDRRRVTAHPAGNRRLTRRRVLDQPNAISSRSCNPAARVTRRHPHRSALVSDPVTMTGTVHRPMELTNLPLAE